MRHDAGRDPVLAGEPLLPHPADHEQRSGSRIDRQLALDEGRCGEIVDVVHGAHDPHRRALVADAHRGAGGDAVLHVEDGGKSVRLGMREPVASASMAANTRSSRRVLGSGGGTNVHGTAIGRKKPDRGVTERDDLDREGAPGPAPRPAPGVDHAPRGFVE